jgi:hypothetical protein
VSDPGDLLDGCCDLDFEMGPPTTAAILPWVVLFADLIDTEQRPIDLHAVHQRGVEWRALFGTGGGT